MKYFRILIWKPKDTELVHLVLKEFFGPDLFPKKIPRQSRFRKKQMVGTSQMTGEIEDKLKVLLKGKLTILRKEPKIWFEK